MATEKLIHLTFKNTALAKDPRAKEWLDKVAKELDERTKEMMGDMVTFGQCFFTNREGRVLRIKPQDFYPENYIQVPQPLEVGMRVKGRNLPSHLTEWYLDSIDHEKNSCVVKGINPKWDTPLRVVITNINDITEWTQN